MESATQLERRQRTRRPLARPAVAPAADSRLALAAAIGNRAFTAMVARSDPEAAAATAAGATFIGPAGYGTATTAGGAHDIVWEMDGVAGDYKYAGFDAFKAITQPADDWLTTLARRPRASALTADEADALTMLADDFEELHDETFTGLVEALVAKLRRWGKQQPISDDDLFELREAVHAQFVHEQDEDRIAQIAELLGETEKLVGEVKKWVGYAAKAEQAIKKSKRLADVQSGIAEISSKVGRAKKIVDLTESIGRLSGVLGATPGGVDEIGTLEGALGVMDFAVSKFDVPGLGVLWDDYIVPATEFCLKQLRGIDEDVYAENRGGGVRWFFDEHRNAERAPKIEDAILRGAFTEGEHFPGGQPMLDFMWKLMLDPEAADSVPRAVEVYFLEWRDLMNAGAGGDELEVEGDWNPLVRNEAPNIGGWLKRNRDAAWVKLYGGMPKPG